VHRGEQFQAVRSLKTIHKVGHFFQFFISFMVVLEESIGFSPGFGQQLNLDRKG
jgi:hypothetical protein